MRTYERGGPKSFICGRRTQAKPSRLDECRALGLQPRRYHQALQGVDLVQHLQARVVGTQRRRQEAAGGNDEVKVPRALDLKEPMALQDDSPFFSTIVLLKNWPFSLGFCRVL